MCHTERNRSTVLVMQHCSGAPSAVSPQNDCSSVVDWVLVPNMGFFFPFCVSVTLSVSPSEWRGQLPCVHHLLPPVPSDATGQASEQRGGHSDAAVDVHQVAAGQRAGPSRGWSLGKWVGFAVELKVRLRINSSFLSQALPYVALLIAMIFFIYAVIGMQVSLQNWQDQKKTPPPGGHLQQTEALMLECCGR